MSKKVYNLIVLVSGSVSTLASGLVTFFAPPHASAVVGCIGVANTALIECLSFFVKKEE